MGESTSGFSFNLHPALANCLPQWLWRELAETMK
jgi:hypothetical protein